MTKFLLLFALFGIFSIPIFADNAFGHGGAEQAPSIDFGGMAVTVSTILNPIQLVAGEVDSANLEIRFFDTLTNENLDQVTYRIEIFKGEDLLARNLFYDEDGELNVEIRPKTGCINPNLLKCTKYFGEKDPIAGGYIGRGDTRPVIEGPIFDKGGLYKIKVDIVGATSPVTSIAQPLSFETFVSVAEDQKFLIPIANAELPVQIKSFYDTVSNFEFNQSDNSISFEMPFDWDQNNLQNIQAVHQEVRIPKSFSPYEDVSLKGFVNGVEVDNRALLIDPFSYENDYIFYLTISGIELNRIHDNISPSYHDEETMFFKLIPQAIISKNSVDFYLVDTNNFQPVGTTVNIAWDNRYGVGDVIPFEFAFFDENGNLLKDIRYGYSLIDQNDKVILTNIGDDKANLGIVAFKGIDIQRIVIPTQEQYRVDVSVFGTGINYDPTYAGIGSGLIEVGPGVPSSPPTPKPTPEQKSISIPGWIKNNAGWWADGQIDDSSFASGIEYMIKEGIIQVPVTERQEGTESAIPDWVRNNAGWWSEGLISDEDFAGGLQYLIANGIISV